MQEIIIPDLSELAFADATHTYLLNGVEIPSVSAVMKPLSQHEYGGVDERTLEAAANKGTAVHNAIENWLKFGIADLDPEYQGYLDGFLEWWEQHKPVVVGSEIRTYHKLLRYAGTVDLLAMIDGELNLIDYKTTYRLIDKNCRVQLEAYSQALSSHGITVAKKRILHLAKDGKWKDPMFETKDAEAWRVFGSLKCVYDYTS